MNERNDHAYDMRACLICDLQFKKVTYIYGANYTIQPKVSFCVSSKRKVKERTFLISLFALRPKALFFIKRHEHLY